MSFMQMEQKHVERLSRKTRKRKNYQQLLKVSH